MGRNNNSGILRVLERLTGEKVRLDEEKRPSKGSFFMKRPYRRSMSEQPNVLWIMADQHNPKCTTWGSYPTQVNTPNLERLATSGIRFDRAFAQSPSCTPSRTSFLTGQYPLNHGCYDNGGEHPTSLLPCFST